MMVRIFISLMALVMTATLSLAQQGPLRIEITEGVIEPLPFATPNFVAEKEDITRLVNALGDAIQSLD